jgi:chromosome segregation ATPase
VAHDAAAQHEIDRLRAEVDRLRSLERGLLAERDRMRAELAAEVARLQEALKSAAGQAGSPVDGRRQDERELTDRARSLAEHERRLRERELKTASAEEGVRRREAELAAARASLEASRKSVAAERERLAEQRRRLEQESDRLAEWEREALRHGPATPLPATFHEGLNRLAERGSAAGPSTEGSW